MQGPTYECGQSFGPEDDGFYVGLASPIGNCASITDSKLCKLLIWYNIKRAIG